MKASIGMPIIALVALSGCASIIKGSDQSIAITTPPATGANCMLSSAEGNWSVISPGIAHVEKSKEDIEVRCAKPGYQDGIATIPSDFEGWTVGNIIFGGLIGVGVDAATGAINEYPHAFAVPMAPIYAYAPSPTTAPFAVDERDTPPVQPFDAWQQQNAQNPAAQQGK